MQLKTGLTMGPTQKDSAEGTVSSCMRFMCILVHTLLPPASVCSTSRLSSLVVTDIDVTHSGDFGGGVLSSWIDVNRSNTGGRGTEGSDSESECGVSASGESSTHGIVMVNELRIVVFMAGSSGKTVLEVISGNSFLLDPSSLEFPVPRRIIVHQNGLCLPVPITKAQLWELFLHFQMVVVLGNRGHLTPHGFCSILVLKMHPDCPGALLYLTSLRSIYYIPIRLLNVLHSDILPSIHSLPTPFSSWFVDSCWLWLFIFVLLYASSVQNLMFG